MELKKALELRVKYGIEDVVKVDKDGYVCLTDMVKFFPGKRLDVWLNANPTKAFINTLQEFLNTTYRCSLKIGSVSTLADKKVLITKRGKYYGGTFAHYDLAMEFAMWLSPEFKLKVIQSYRLGTQRKEDWNIKRIMAAENYKLQCEAIDSSGENEKMHGHGYSNNAKMLNKFVFGKHENDIRDIASSEELDQLSYLESRNGSMIEMGFEYHERKEMLKNLFLKYKVKNIKKVCE